MPNREVFHLAHKIRMSAEDSESAELMLWGEIIPDLPKYYKEQYPNDKSSSDFDRDIKELREKGVKKLLMRINSPGGIVTESVAMRSILANAGFEEINIRIEGLCASAATNIATLPGAHVQIADHAIAQVKVPQPRVMRDVKTRQFRVLPDKQGVELLACGVDKLLQ